MAKSAHLLFMIFLLLLLGPSVGAAELRILPDKVLLTGPHAFQQVLVVRMEKGQVVADVTGEAKLTVTLAEVAAIDREGMVRPAGDGETILTAHWKDQVAEVPVRVCLSRAPLDWSFRNHVIPLMTRAGCSSGACHGALAGKGGLKLSLRGYDPETDHFVLTRQALGRRVDRQEPAHSLLLLKSTMTVPHAGGKKVDPGTEDYRVLSDWIASGAPGPAPNDVQIQRLEALPAQAILKPGQTLQVLVRAWYSDGHAEDVTRWVKFSSSEDLVATITPEGKARVPGPGETHISVWFSNLVATSRITVPLPKRPDPEVFARAPRESFIDELVLAKLAQLNIPPSPPCSDAEFIRRLYLDTAGILPTPKEVETFLADQGKDRKARLIDRLLERPEYVDYWAYKWSDLLLISTRRLPQPAVWSFYQFVRQSVADNKPWSQLARDILTARGSTLQSGAAAYYVLHKDVTDLTESTALTFLGMSVTCCRCHNHPLEKWTQDQYWSLANLFSRVVLKDGDRQGDVLVQVLPTGDVSHPRRGIPMPPAPLDARPLAANDPGDRRAHFVAWLTAPENPYFARALVNRVWRSYMGRGLVEAEDDLRQTNPPTNPELLDALARDFVAHKYDVKHLIRVIVQSAAYQRSSQPLPGNVADDRFYSHYLVRRLPAEVILDAYSQVTGVPTSFEKLGTRGGDSATLYPGYPLGTRALQLPDALVLSHFLDAFGRPERLQTCSCERQQDSSVSQALHLNNGKTLNDKLRSQGSLIDRLLKERISDEKVLRRLFLLALSRPPSAEEHQRLLTLLASAETDKEGSRQEVLEDLFWSVLTSKEFLFNH